MSEIKVYRLNEYDWVAAESMEEAIEWYCRTTGVARSEATDEDVRELDEREMERTVFTLEDGDQISFAEQLERCLDAEREAPFLFASTEY